MSDKSFTRWCFWLLLLYAIPYWVGVLCWVVGMVIGRPFPWSPFPWWR